MTKRRASRPKRFIAQQYPGLPEIGPVFAAPSSRAGRPPLVCDGAALAGATPLESHKRTWKKPTLDGGSA